DPRPTIEGLLEAGCIYRTLSLWNTPILPVLKAGGETYRMVQDFRAVNEVTTPIDLPVPDPHIILSNLSPKHRYFTVVDLANAFFSIPLDEASQPLFAFTYENQQFTYSVLPQGYTSSPEIFNYILKTHLAELKIPEGVILIQYVDDLLLGAPTSDLCLEMTKTLLDFLAVKGYKVKMSKVQSCRRTVLFLGREISSEGAGLSKSHRDSILHHPRPITVSGMLSFLGLTGYSRTHIPDYTERTEPLREIVREAGPRNLQAPLTWTPEASTAFGLLKTDLSVAAALTAPDYGKTFHLDVSEKEGFPSAVLFQKHEGERRVLMYHSSKLDHIETGQTACSRYVAAVAKAIEKTAHLVMCHKMQIHTHHGMAAYLISKEFTFSVDRKNQIQNKCTQSHITFVNTDKNMADALTAEDGLAHSCQERAAQELKLRPDLENEPLTSPDLWLYTDGCCYKGDTVNVAAYAVVQQLHDKTHVTLESGIIPQPASAQLAEIVALTQALEKAEGKTVNIYTDSAYAHGAVHIDGPQWVRRNFTTTGAEDLVLRTQGVNPGYRGRSRRDTTPSSGDPSYIDAIGVPRGVPDEYKLIDQGYQESYPIPEGHRGFISDARLLQMQRAEREAMEAKQRKISAIHENYVRTALIGVGSTFAHHFVPSIQCIPRPKAPPRPLPRRLEHIALAPLKNVVGVDGAQVRPGSKLSGVHPEGQEEEGQAGVEALKAQSDQGCADNNGPIDLMKEVRDIEAHLKEEAWEVVHEVKAVGRRSLGSAMSTGEIATSSLGSLSSVDMNTPTELRDYLYVGTPGKVA
ncbi:uncharacterized protein LOC116367125, partial [Oncorhynchus kisutch]|uniref:uncharacterized protein LOC116367125 n=1 Tax=Oncorhynchus kisutch TaxID=8019 RepID=UPI0012DF45B3